MSDSRRQRFKNSGDNMEIITKKVKDLKPYERNPRRNDEAVEYVAESISEFGFKVPIVIDGDGTVICGHTRLKAAKKLHLAEVPCIVADDLDDEQIKAFRLADNKVAEKAEWDFGFLDKELGGIFNFDMGKFGFNFMPPEVKQKNKLETKTRKANILNLERAQFTGVGKYDIPEIQPVYQLPEVIDWIPFDFMLSDKRSPEEKQKTGVHFFRDDYKFERIWNTPEKYIEKLAEYACVLSPDFSPYGDMPMATQIFNHYRKHWVAVYMQECGLTVIPTIRASTDERCKEWYLEGEPRGSVIAISSMWTKDGTTGADAFEWEFQTMLKELNPSKVFVYGKLPKTEFENIERIPSFAETRFAED